MSTNVEVQTAPVVQGSHGPFTPPGWVMWLVGAAGAVVVSVIGTINWLDSKYATKEELRLYVVQGESWAKDLAEIKEDTKLTKSKVVELRVLMAKIIAVDEVK